MLTVGAKKFNLVFIAMETTGLYSPDILQLGAVSQCGNIKFNSYAMPTKPIEPGAFKIHNISLKSDGQLYLSDQLIPNPAANDEVLLENFLDWIRVNFQGPVGLVAFNGVQFGFDILLDHFIAYKMQCKDLITGFIDPMAYAKRKKLYHINGRMRQSDLLKLFKVKPAAEGHNAAILAENLRRLVVKMNQTHPDLLQFKRRAKRVHFIPV